MLRSRWAGRVGPEAASERKGRGPRWAVPVSVCACVLVQARACSCVRARRWRGKLDA